MHWCCTHYLANVKLISPSLTLNLSHSMLVLYLVMEEVKMLPFKHEATVRFFFANTTPLFALIPEPTNQPLHNNDVIIAYRTIWYM